MAGNWKRRRGERNSWQGYLVPWLFGSRKAASVIRQPLGGERTSCAPGAKRLCCAQGLGLLWASRMNRVC